MEPGTLWRVGKPVGLIVALLALALGYWLAQNEAKKPWLGATKAEVQLVFEPGVIGVTMARGKEIPGGPPVLLLVNLPDYIATKVSSSYRGGSLRVREATIRGVVPDLFLATFLAPFLALGIGYVLREMQATFGDVFWELWPSLSYWKVKHVVSNHRWLGKYGLSRLHTDENAPRGHYYDALKLLTEGYMRLFLERATDSCIRVTLYNDGTPVEIWQLLTNDADREQLDELYRYWENMATVTMQHLRPDWPNEKLFEISRAFVCDREQYERDMGSFGTWEKGVEVEALSDWYTRHFPGAPAFPISTEPKDIKRIAERLGKNRELDFAVFQGASKPLWIGFIKGRLTYVLYGPDVNDVGLKLTLHEHSRVAIGKTHPAVGAAGP